MPYRVLIDGSKLLDAKTDGIKRYVVQLLKELAQCAGADWQIDVQLSPGHVAPLSHIAAKLASNQPLPAALPTLLSPGKDNPLLVCKERIENGSRGSLVHRLADEVQLQALRLSRSCLRRWLEFKAFAHARTAEPYDLVHLTLPNTWKMYARFPARFVTTVHDLSHQVCPQFQNQANAKSLQQGLDFAASVDSQYIAVSHSTALQLEHVQPLENQRVHVVHEGVDSKRFFSPVVESAARKRLGKQYGLPSGRFLLSLGTLEPRKNLLNTVRAFRQVVARPTCEDAHLVIAGRRGWGDQREFAELVASCPRIHTIGYVDEKNLPALYAMCTGFCYVSHYEGFGLPVLEAMSCGAPVVYGDNSSMPEVAADGGIAANSDDIGAIADAMGSLLTDPILRSNLARRALERANQFTWRATARKTLQVYQYCMSNSLEHTEPCLAKAA